MRKYLCLLPLLLLSLTANAQGGTIAAFNLKQAETLKFGMLALGAWALVNILISSIKLTKSSRNKRFFFQMNIYWNIVNMIIAGGSLYYILSADAGARTLPQTVDFHFWNLRLLYLSIGLDLAFLMLAAYLKEKSLSSPKAEQYLGYGQSITLQAMFLLVLDVTLVVLLEGPGQELLQLVQG
ncbi:DUF6992 family protein [Pontibacter ramchanderi]|uniref:Uncharacterized protein n=1 Tax=Pontibacter ramchanderi TaxID=1179743 RepID=A0A2N3UC80_9BACT|nr:hypothetical protein [Pontibacter ramchanderi]PKV66951.1 hypothetical protein BD749_2089 [Pontibacter ramchanderi]